MYRLTVRGETEMLSLKQQFGRNPLLSPRPIRPRHLSDQRLEVLGNRRTPAPP
jgi:hypothetical protein